MTKVRRIRRMTVPMALLLWFVYYRLEKNDTHYTTEGSEVENTFIDHLIMPNCFEFSNIFQLQLMWTWFEIYSLPLSLQLIIVQVYPKAFFAGFYHQNRNPKTNDVQCPLIATSYLEIALISPHLRTISSTIELVFGIRFFCSPILS